MTDLLNALGIQWSVLLAQTVNFVILVFILKRFLYKPVLKVIDQRRDLIADSMKKVQEIDKRKEELDKERVKILRKADEEAGALLKRAKEEAESMRTEIEKAAQAQASHILQKGMEQLDNERAIMVKEIQNKLAHAIVLSAEKILRREFSKEDQDSFESELKKNLPSMLS
jgi:F-type H+-transporting ATPase subunit b